MKRVLAATLVSGTMLLMVAAPALASDHVGTAASSPGSDDRGFTNPVTGNPGDAQGDPGTVPGEGNPNDGAETGTPAVNLGLVDDRSGGHGNPQAE
jgi:hypothetical protein